MKHAPLSLLVLLVGCGYRYTPTTQNAAAAKPANCTFELLTTRPARPYVELGVLEPEGGAKDGGTARAAMFKDKVADDVCRAGGDAVLTELNGLGVYVRGTVIKYQDDAGQQATASGAQLPAGAPPPAPTAVEPAAAPVAPGSVGAIVSVPSAEIRSAPFNVAPVTTVVQQGQRLSVAPAATNGWRAAKLTDGRAGYVQDASIKVDASAP